MSELKAFEVTGKALFGRICTKKVYDKDEADKVIAEKDEEIDELKESIDQLQKATDSAWSKVNAMYDELRHNKHKRCLAMAKWCFDEGKGTPTVYEVRTFYWGRWGNIWLALAEEPTWAKFLQLIRKEAK